MDVVAILEKNGIQPSAHRVAVAQYVLTTHDHPSAERVWARVLLRERHLTPDSVVFDANTERHHHLIDDATGKIYDVDWHKVEVPRITDIDAFEISEYQVVMHGRKRPKGKRKP